MAMHLKVCSLLNLHRFALTFLALFLLLIVLILLPAFSMDYRYRNVHHGMSHDEVLTAVGRPPDDSRSDVMVWKTLEGEYYVVMESNRVARTESYHWMDVIFRRW
jgi:hypothetical protein